MQPRNPTHALLQKFERMPFGLNLFSRAVCFKAPYFRSVKPRFDEIRPGFAKAFMKKRRAVTNHLGTVHAVAMANLCEFVGGTLMEVSIPKHMRWIPKALEITYHAKATSDLSATCTIENYDWETTQDVWLDVNVHDTQGVLVSSAKIPMYVSEKPNYAEAS